MPMVSQRWLLSTSPQTFCKKPARSIFISGEMTRQYFSASQLRETKNEFHG
jgi:hypothetical protein